MPRRVTERIATIPVVDPRTWFPSNRCARRSDRSGSFATSRMVPDLGPSLSGAVTAPSASPQIPGNPVLDGFRTGAGLSVSGTSGVRRADVTYPAS